MLVLRLPVRRQAFEAQAHRPGGQIGKLRSFDQDDEPAVLGQEMQSPFPLFHGPFDGLVGALRWRAAALQPIQVSQVPWASVTT